MVQVNDIYHLILLYCKLLQYICILHSVMTATAHLLFSTVHISLQANDLCFDFSFSLYILYRLKPLYFPLTGKSYYLLHNLTFQMGYLVI